MENYFALLNSINVNEHIEHKGQFSYLSWPFAVAQLRLTDPTAAWEVKRFEGMPFLKTECGYFVEVAVTVQGVTLSQVHPVLDGKNRPLLDPEQFRYQHVDPACSWSRPSLCMASACISTLARICRTDGQGDMPKQMPVPKRVWKGCAVCEARRTFSRQSGITDTSAA